MTDYNVQSQMITVQSFLTLVSMALTSTERREDKALAEFRKKVSEHDSNRMYKKLVEEDRKLNDTKFAVTRDNVAFYSAKNQDVAADIHNVLVANGIPTVLFSLNGRADAQTVILVPKQYEKEADKYIESANKFLVKTEIPRGEFYRIHLGENIAQFDNISKTELAIIRKQMESQPVEYCVEQKSASYTVSVEKESKHLLEAALFLAKSYCEGKEAATYLEKYEERARQEKEIVEILQSDKKDMLIADIRTPDRVYRLHDGRFIEYSTEESRVIAVKDKSELDFAAKIFRELEKAKSPIVKITEPSFKLPNTYSVYDICSREEIAKAKERMSVEDKLNGYESTGEALAAQIVALQISHSGPDYNCAEVLNGHVRFSEMITEMNNEEMQRAGVAELFERYQKLNLTPDEDENVLQFGINIMRDTQAMENDIQADADMLSITEIGTFLETAREVIDIDDVHQDREDFHEEQDNDER